MAELLIQPNPRVTHNEHIQPLDRLMTSLLHTWGTQPLERDLAYPCSRFLAGPNDAYYRGITIAARPEVVFRWLCQMRVAPYSYDWIDNGGRQSPRQLTPGLDELAIGQEVMGIFELVDFARDQRLTLRMQRDRAAYRVFGDVAVSYCIIPNGARECRLLVKMIVRYPPGITGWLVRRLLPSGDLIMMRRQLLNFKKLAEQPTGTA
jgi:hypothetical protein